MVYNLCLNYLQSTVEAEESTQDVFLKVHAKYAQFDKRSSLKTWIYRITINQCLDQLKARKRKKRDGIMVRLFNFGATEASNSVQLPDFDHPGILLEHQEAVDGLFARINALPKNQRAAILLKSTEGLSQQEIAEVLNIGVKAVESLLSRGRKNLRTMLAASEGKPTQNRQSSSIDE